MTSESGGSVSRRWFAMEPWLARVAIIAMLSTLAMNAIRPMIAYRALDLGATPVEIGFIAASFSILPFVSAVPIGGLIDRVGGGSFVVLGMVVVAITSFAAIFSDSLPALGLTYAVMGLGQTINLVSQQTTIANRGGRAGRDERYGLYTTMASVGQLIGPAMAGVLGGGVLFAALGVDVQLANEQAPVFLVAGLISAIAAVLAIPLARYRRPHRPGDEVPEAPVGLATTAGRVLRRPGMLRAMLVSIVVVSSIDVLVAYLPVYGEEHGLSVGLVGLLLSVRAGASLVSRVLLGRVLRVLGRRVVLGCGLTLAGVGMFLLAPSPPQWVLFVVMAMFGLGVGIGQPITISWVADQSPRSERATAIGIRLMGNRAALLTVPLGMGLIAGAAGVGMTFAAVAAMLTAGALTAATTAFGSPTRGDAR